MQTLKRCCWCDENKPASEFNKDRRRKDGLRSECRACESARKRRAYEVACTKGATSLALSLLRKGATKKEKP